MPVEGTDVEVQLAKQCTHDIYQTEMYYDKYGFHSPTDLPEEWLHSVAFKWRQIVKEREYDPNIDRILYNDGTSISFEEFYGESK